MFNYKDLKSSDGKHRPNGTETVIGLTESADISIARRHLPQTEAIVLGRRQVTDIRIQLQRLASSTIGIRNCIENLVKRIHPWNNIA